MAKLPLTSVTFCVKNVRARDPKCNFILPISDFKEDMKAGKDTGSGPTLARTGFLSRKGTIQSVLQSREFRAREGESLAWYHTAGEWEGGTRVCSCPEGSYSLLLQPHSPA